MEIQTAKKIGFLMGLLFFLSFPLLSQKYTIPLAKDRQTGLSYVKASISDIEKSFIFDTGASSIVINSAFFRELLSKKKVSTQDIVGTGQSVVANGATVTIQILQVKNFQIGNFLIPQIEIVVMPDPQAPLLVGQSVFSQFGKITIDNAQNMITLEKETSTNHLANLKEVKLVPCFASSQQTESNIKYALKAYINPKLLTEESNLPPQKATDRIKCEVQIRYFANQSRQSAEEIKKRLEGEISTMQICTENMTPYFSQEIPNYIEIWVK